MTTDFRPYKGAASQPFDDNSQNGNAVDGNGNGNGTAKTRWIGLSEEMEIAGDKTLPMDKAYGSRNASSEVDVTITQPAGTSPAQWMRNLSVGKKQLTGLLASELIAVLGLVGVSSFSIIDSGRQQLFEQAETELAVMALADTSLSQATQRLSQQAVNPAIVEVAAASAAGQSPSADAIANARQLLQAEQAASNLEYATLVGRDKRIIAGANANRVGAQFDPEGLVGTVLQNPRSITTFAIVSEAELQVEKPPLPEGFTPQDVLIQYTFTPVRATNSDTVVGVLVSGNIINGEEVIPAAILETLEEGYGAIYQRQSDGSYDLAATTGITAAPTLDAELLSQLQADPAQIFTSRTQANDQSYGLAARTLTNFQQEPVGIIVRGLPESSLNQVLSNKLRLQLLVALLIVVANLGIAYALRNIILNPLKNLQQATWQFGLGERQARADIYSKDEVGQVAYVFNQIADKIVASEDLLYTQQQADRAMARQSQTLVELSSELRQKMDPEHILDTSVDSMRQALEVDRVLIYRFDDDLKSGEITAESVGQGWQRTKGQMVEDPLTPEAIEHFYSGRVNFIEDRDVAGLTHCHCEILKRLEVRANMVAPIIVGDKLVGLLCAHQCSGPRKWTPSELQLMQQLSTQLGYALNQANLMQQQRQTLYWEQQLNEAIARMRETLDEKTIFQIAVNETRQLLESDRSVIYLFDETWKGTFVAESVTDGWSKAINNDLYDPCFADRYVKQYQKGRVQVTPDIYKAGLTDCHINQLETYEVKANLVAPVIVNDELIGLLIVHQCSGPREWDELEVEFIRKISIQLGFAIEQARLLADTRDRQQQLQMQLVELLSDVEGASSGDLTVRANVTAGEIGTVADFFNAIVESLRQIVTKVKESATQVNDSLGENETSIKTLADEALRQADEVTTTLASVQAMTASIQQVADSARQAADVASTASLTAENSGQAMDLTVQNILNLRDIIGETSKKVKRLGESSQQISKVVSLINQIAMQTNLLAINAGIEAARAGEEGQGFAVVAEEVGELAARSADATQEIERIVETIQRETVEVVEAMEQSTTEVVAGTHLVEDAKQSFSRILDVSRQIDQLVQSISSATVSQVEVSETVTKLMQDIAQVSERTSDASLEITSSLRRTVEVAQGLQASVGEFKTGQAQGASSLNAGNPVAQA